MSQFLRAISDIVTTFSKSAGTYRYECVDEESYSDSDYIYKARSSAGTYYQEFGLTVLGTPPSAGTCTCRFRHKSLNGTTINNTATIRVGSSAVKTDSPRGPGTSYGTVSFTFDASLITNWADVRIRFTGSWDESDTLYVSWCELEVPDAPILAGLEMGMMY